MVVIDTKITMAWCFEDEATAAIDAVLDGLRGEVAVVPAAWPLKSRTCSWSPNGVSG